MTPTLSYKHGYCIDVACRQVPSTDTSNYSAPKTHQ